jgi:DNA-binding NarL/FixJ family response regulator
LLSPGITRKLIAEYVSRPPEPSLAAGLDVLTNREREVVALVARGLSNAETAERMVISPATARTHVSRAMVKLGARDRAQLAVFAYESGLVAPRVRRSARDVLDLNTDGARYLDRPPGTASTTVTARR